MPILEWEWSYQAAVVVQRTGARVACATKTPSHSPYQQHSRHCFQPLEPAAQAVFVEAIVAQAQPIPRLKIRLLYCQVPVGAGYDV